MHSCFTSSIFAARTLDFAVKFGFVFRSEAVVFRRYVLALLSVGLLRKFEAYQKLFPSVLFIFSKIPPFYLMLPWFRLIIPSFPAQIDDMRSRFSALSWFWFYDTQVKTALSSGSFASMGVRPVSRKPRKLFGPVKPFLVYLHERREPLFKLRIFE